MTAEEAPGPISEVLVVRSMIDSAVRLEKSPPRALKKAAMAIGTTKTKENKSSVGFIPSHLIDRLSNEVSRPVREPSE